MRLVRCVFVCLMLLSYMHLTTAVHAQVPIDQDTIGKWKIGVELYLGEDTRSSMVRVWAPINKKFASDCQMGRIYKGRFESTKIETELCPCKEKLVNPMVKQLLDLKIKKLKAVLIFPDAMIFILDPENVISIDEWMVLLGETTKTFERFYNVPVTWVKKTQ